MSSRWLYKWKQKPGEERKVKARLVIRGYEDNDAQALATWANTATRWGQRIVCSVATQNQWTMLSADVGTAFLRGLTFPEPAALTGEPERVVCFDPPAEYCDLVAKLAGLSGMNWEKETLRMLRPVYGLKDAPRAWRRRLHEALTGLGFLALKTDSALYTLRGPDDSLACLLSAHVDDLKCTGTEAALTYTLDKLSGMFGKLTIDRNCFDHCGLRHEQDVKTFAIKVHQNQYVVGLKAIDISSLDLSDENVKVPEAMIKSYQSLLGGLGWLIQTRQDITIYVQALQRHNHSPSTANVLRMSKVCRWVKRRPFFLLYEQLQTPELRIITISDAAFRREDETGLATRGAQICLGELHGDHPGGRVHQLEWYSKRQRRITRSTFGAELNALGDGHEQAKVIGFAFCELMSRTLLTARDLCLMDDNGTWPIQLHAAIDCRSVFDAVANEEPKKPTESSLIMLLLQIKEQLSSGSLRKLWWVSTTDMAADGLNKGGVSRSGIMKLCMSGTWSLTKDCVFHEDHKSRS